MTEPDFIKAPLSSWEAVSKSFQLWWQNIGGVIIFSLTSGVISILPSLLGLEATAHSDVKLMSIIMLITVSLINVVISTVIYAKFVHAVHGQIISVSQAIGLAVMRFPSILIFSLLYFGIFALPIIVLVLLVHSLSGTPLALLVVFLMLAFFLFAMTLFVYTLLVIPIIILEDLKPIPAFKKSIALVRGGWWYTGMVMSAPILVAILAGPLLSILLGKAGIVLGQMLFMPLNVAFITVLYEHHKQRMSSPSVVEHK